MKYGEFEEQSKGIPAWVLSAIFHFVIVLLAAFLIRSPAKGIPTDEPDRTVGIALVKQEQKKTEYITESDQVEPNESSANSSNAVRDALPDLNQLDEQMPGFLPNDDDIGNIGTELGDQLVGADGFLDGIATGPRKVGSTGQTTTEVFGIEGTGTNFVYVFDRSGSMAGFDGRPLAAAKAELIESLDSLGPNQQFQIIFYNERPRAFTPHGGRPKLIKGTEKNKRLAKKFVAGIPGGGATRHMPALKMAVDFAPDIVFFLTDAAEPIISDADLKVIDRWNRNAANIHSIEFGPAAAPAGDNFLKKLARFNGGKYVYKNVTLFKFK